MKARLLLIGLILLGVALALPVHADQGDASKRTALLEAYPGLFRFEGNDLVWSDGTRMVWDDGIERDADALIESPDIEDMFHYAYSLAEAGALTPGINEDPGRIRNEAFFRKLYGSSAREVEATLASIAWVGNSRVQATRLFDVHTRLERVARALEADPELIPYGESPGGGFNWRVIAGTDLLSVHAFGAAFDINTGFADYWRWAEGTGPIAYRNRIPLAVVALFEREGFIWGGRWYHYDTMHFEYRPELLIHARWLGLQP